jgi:hypothetical protein
MDPLSALSVAASVVQFVDFGTKIVSKGRKLYKYTDGALIEHAQVKEASGCLRTLSQSLRLLPPVGSLSQSDEALVSICDGCVEVVDELLSKLKDLGLPKDHKHRKWKRFRQALETVWSKDEIKETEERMAKFRQELDIHVLLSLR